MGEGLVLREGFPALLLEEDGEDHSPFYILRLRLSPGQVVEEELGERVAGGGEVGKNSNENVVRVVFVEGAERPGDALVLRRLPVV